MCNPPLITSLRALKPQLPSRVASKPITYSMRLHADLAHFRSPPWGWVGAQMIQRVEGGKAFYAQHNLSGFKQCVEKAEKFGYVQTGNRVRVFPFSALLRVRADAGRHTVRINPVESGFSSPRRLCSFQRTCSILQDTRSWKSKQPYSCPIAICLVLQLAGSWPRCEAASC